MSGSAYDNTDYTNYLRKAMENEANLQKPKYVGDETPESYLKRFMQTPPHPIHTELDSYMNQFMQRIRERLDSVCLVAIEGGKHGVKVTTNIGDGTIMMEVSEEVPFGEIHYHTEEGVAAWFGPY